MRNVLGILIALALVFSLSMACANSLAFTTAPDVIRPGKYYDIQIMSPAASSATISLLDEQGAAVCNIFTEYPFVLGENQLQWDGRLPDDSIIESGSYQLSVALAGGESVTAPLRIGSPYPMLSGIWQSDSYLEDTPLTVSYSASEAGSLSISVGRPGESPFATLYEGPVDMGDNVFSWDGVADGYRVSDGRYALVFTLTAGNGISSMAEHVYITVGAPPPDPTPVPTPEPTPIPEVSLATDSSEGTPPDGSDTAISPDADADETSEAGAGESSELSPLSPPYSMENDGTYWSMTPGETDDSVIWDIMMQPITVYDDGKISSREHAYMMENPDGSGKKIAQIHGTSQGLHVIGEENEHGYVLVEAFPNYDRDFYPRTDEEKLHALEIKRGYVKKSALKTIEVMPDMALLIDKLTQRMYLFKDGVRVTEMLIATGTFKGDDYLFETPPGEYITVSHTGAFTDGNMTSDMAIRINGGVLIHEVPHKTRADGKYDYSSFEGYLGTKQSHGCIRVQRLKNDEGYNQQWIWDNFRRGQPYKVIIWDDAGRVDKPTTWQENPKN